MKGRVSSPVNSLCRDDDVSCPQECASATVVIPDGQRCGGEFRAPTLLFSEETSSAHMYVHACYTNRPYHLYKQTLRQHTERMEYGVSRELVCAAQVTAMGAARRATPARSRIRTRSATTPTPDTKPAYCSTSIKSGNYWTPWDCDRFQCKSGSICTCNTGDWCVVVCSAAPCCVACPCTAFSVCFHRQPAAVVKAKTLYA